MESEFNFFAMFYQNNLYGEKLFYHLRGWDEYTQDFSNVNQFQSIWLITFFSALALYVIFYYILNHPRFNKWWHWLITMAVLVVGIFLYSRGLVMADIMGTSAHPIDPSLAVGEDSATMFGIYNSILAALLFFVFSVVGRFGSKNCKNTPWKSLINRK